MELDKIYCGKNVDVLQTFEDECIDLVVTSPPYDNLRDYHNEESQSWGKKDFEAIVNELFRVMKKGGVVVWNVNDQTVNGSETGTSFRQALYFMEVGFLLNDTMIWKKPNPMPAKSKCRYTGCFEYMFVFSKGAPKTFNPIQVPTKLKAGTYTFRFKTGINPEDRKERTHTFSGKKNDFNVWEMSVAPNTDKSFQHPAVFPYELPFRHIQSWTNEGDVVLDPFNGSGTTCIAAYDSRRHYIGIECNEDYVNASISKLEKHKLEHPLN